MNKKKLNQTKRVLLKIIELRLRLSDLFDQGCTLTVFIFDFLPFNGSPRNEDHSFFGEEKLTHSLSKEPDSQI